MKHENLTMLQSLVNVKKLKLTELEAYVKKIEFPEIFDLACGVIATHRTEIEILERIINNEKQ